MNTFKTIILTVIFTALIALVLGLFYYSQKVIPKPIGSAPTGAQAVSGSSSLVTLPGTTALQIFASSTCVSRIIGFADTSIRLTFVDSATNPSATFGTNQNSSTSVPYDSAIYGCGLWRAFNPLANLVTFTITEFGGFQ